MSRNGKADDRRVVNTSKNTSLADWKAMVVKLAAETKVDISRVSELSFKHAWECEDTPVSFVTIVKLMNDRAERARNMKRIKSESADT